ncbi:MAG TPA: AAA family ATPase [Methylophilaceae bacterium]|nr:AAA family ATPase [Methylophilaceae bacterium]
MYYAHFGLKQPPFKITPNTEFFFSGGNRGVILDALIYAITSGEGIIKVVGEVGSGKTMLCRMLQTLLPEKVESVYLANPSMAPEDVLHAIAFELQLKLPKNADRLQVMQALQSYLLQRHEAGKQVVIFVEEAQGMPLATLEEIRLLSNLETKHDKLLQIVLFGQPELDVNLNETQIRQLRERITHSFNLGPLDETEIGEYLIFRLRAAGYYGPHMFTKAAIRKLSQAAEGLVRRVNILADKSLLSAFAENVYQVTPRHVNAAIRDSEFGGKKTGSQGRRAYAAIAATLLLGLVMGYFLNQRGIRESSASVQHPVSPQAAAKEKRVISEPVRTIVSAPVHVASNKAATAETALATTTAPVATAVLVSEPAALDDILERRLSATRGWLSQQPAGTVSIQLMGGGNDDQLRKQLESLSSQVELDNIYVFRTRVANKPFVTVLYGSYANRDEALLGMQKLPRILRSYKPQLRTVGGILEETRPLQ